MKHILSIQSHVAYGYVGNRAAVFPLQRLGYDVTAVNTVQFSNHTGYDAWAGDVHSLQHINKVLSGVEAQHPLASYCAIITGYLGDVALAEAVFERVQQAKQQTPELIYCCDPVMGDSHCGLYVKPELPPFFRQHALAASDILTPNLFELSMLSEQELRTQNDVTAACQLLHQQGATLILVTSNTLGVADNELAMLVSDGQQQWQLITPRVFFPHHLSGTGDATVAIFLAHYLAHKDAARALQFVGNALYEILLLTQEKGTRELQLIAAQESLVNPEMRFRVEVLKKV